MEVHSGEGLMDGLRMISNDTPAGILLLIDGA
jgi:hypothetical protein